MSDVSGINCVTVTTLVVVSLANLILLIMMLLESKKVCPNNIELSDNFRIHPLTRLSPLTSGNNRQSHELRSDARFMASLNLVKQGKFLLICGTTIISKFWVLTAAHCCETVKVYSFDRIKIASNSARWRNGIRHDVDEIVRHANFTPRSVSHNICLIRVRTAFRERYEVPVPLASSRYKYVADTPAMTLGWSSRVGINPDDLYRLDLKLMAFQACKARLKNDNVDETMVCAYGAAKGSCSFDSGGPLVQDNVVIGLVSFETDCLSGGNPRVFTRISYFEKWFEQVERQNNIKVGAKFKP